jgi:hypothetical protein
VKSKYVCQLPEYFQTKIKRSLVSQRLRSQDIDAAMHSRVHDLDDTIGVDAIAITEEDIQEITAEMILDIFKVKRVAEDCFSIYGYEYGTEVKKHVGYAKDTAKWLNGYFGISYC